MPPCSHMIRWQMYDLPGATRKGQQQISQAAGGGAAGEVAGVRGQDGTRAWEWQAPATGTLAFNPLKPYLQMSDTRPCTPIGRYMHQSARCFQSVACALNGT